MSEPSPAKKRHLPILQEPKDPPEEEDDRPPWHWAGIGAVAVLVIWLPLAFLAVAALDRVLGSAATIERTGPRWTMIGVHLAVFALASFLGGTFVGRFGAKAGVREATLAGFLAPAIVWSVVVLGQRTGLLVWALLLVLLGVTGALSARLGGRIGLSRRGR